MLDLKMLKQARIRHPRPLAQRMMMPFLTFDYNRPPRTEIIVEGMENIPQDRPVFLAMNHTDRFNYAPFLWRMHREGLPRYVTTWVKGKYFQNPMLARLLLWTGSIPLPSRGYVIASTFRKRQGREPSAEEYRLLRDLMDEELSPDDPRLREGELAAYLSTWGQGPASFAHGAEALFEEMMGEVMRLHREAMGEAERHLLVFPEGTRTRRLIEGKTGLVQAAQHLGLPIVPVACIGGDTIYPGNLPFSMGGRVIYRVRAPLAVDDPLLAPFRVSEPFTPFTREASRRHGDRFQAATRVIMDQIHELLPPRYQRDPSGENERQHGEEVGVDRFL